MKTSGGVRFGVYRIHRFLGLQVLLKGLDL